ncbi:hypothetical protein RPC_2175 [Rhodopseudomonas palustris BisB18]|uniref:Uncharacterized protein n=1 Tax=Rhodopseudomonas palustris (strain BisB18) TaxID=316056 RepID=Q216F7_RHOPB
MQRRRSKPHSFEDQIARHRGRLEAQASQLPEGPEREAVNQKIGQLQVASRMNSWLSRTAEQTDQRLDAELLPMQRPRCPKCQVRMVSVAVAPEPNGAEERVFKCLKCNESRARRSEDPLRSGAVGWLAGELRKPG